ncbi:MAG: hypothetical protein M3247_02095 [Thermoproteota archaeon]|nr:hypothetical protein [Thermoproteota archaeon]
MQETAKHILIDSIKQSGLVIVVFHGEHYSLFGFRTSRFGPQPTVATWTPNAIPSDKQVAGLASLLPYVIATAHIWRRPCSPVPSAYSFAAHIL